MFVRSRILAAVALLCALPVAVAETPQLTPEQLMKRLEAGEANPNPLFQKPEERLVSFSNVEQFSPVRTVYAPTEDGPLQTKLEDLSGLTFETEDGEEPLAEFLKEDALRAMVVIRDNEVLMEHYAPGHDRDTRWISFSVTKSVSSLLVGAALQDGYINSVEDRVTDYLPRLKGSEYDHVTIRQLLQMASGVAWNEDYEDPESDVAIAGVFNGKELANHLSGLPRVAPPGARFNYNTGEANLTGELVRAAVSNSAAAYLSEKIWRPMQMESDAYWPLDKVDGREAGGCCIAATARDYARIGQFALNDGVLPDGTRVLPEGWMAMSTTPSPGSDEYGFMWWLDGDRYLASGIFSQKIYVDPVSRVVIGVHSNAGSAVGSDYVKNLSTAMRAITEHFRD